jgi:4-hydroxy-3-polyprenylbenzoate decarboxylase
MAYRDLREWIDKIDKAGELKRVAAQVDWNDELGSITRRVSDRNGPALLFENIKDYQSTWCRRLFTNSTGSESRMAMALGLPRTASYREVTKAIRERLDKPVEPAIVKTGPAKENISRGKDVDITQIPVPKWCWRDGGRYINTRCMVVTMDPDTKQMNVGTYRGMLSTRNTISTLLATTQHWGQHFTKWRARGEEMPIAVVYGWDPTLFFCSCTPIVQAKRSEYEYAGGLREQPVDVVKCELSDLMVPAAAEIVLEGAISADPKTFEMEGPFGEYTGYYGGEAARKPVMRVDCVTYRNEPIFEGCLAGSSPGHLHEAGVAAAFCAVIWEHLDKVGIPNVLGVWTPPTTNGTNLRVQIRKIYRGHAKQVANAIWGSPLANYVGKNVIVVDEDIDIYDDQSVEWALAYRTNAEMGDISFFEGTFGSMLDPSVPLPQRNIQKYGQGKWTRVLFDATVNWELEPQEQYGGQRYPILSTEISPEMDELMNKRWKEYGLS